ncbi:bacteriocin-protection protein [Pontibacter arcticus]|uniref:Bacteriocin-protection protein n=1 Tax=Pontibacter arcticus TaxID=2080288 RepID=A0A364RCZ8_9BACT|nr:bacteriocin-protection protein [Pontibacter arcticus]
MKPAFFADQAAFRNWLAQHHAHAKELLVGFYKVGSGKASMTWPQSVDQALCYGWIDGVRKSIDAESYCIRFTPRKPKSIWSNVNIKKVAALTEQGLMQPAGLAAFSLRTEARSGVYTFENAPVELDEKFENQLKENTAAWEFYQKQAPSYKRTVASWIMSAKQPATQQNRIQKLISKSEACERI